MANQKKFSKANDAPEKKKQSENLPAGGVAIPAEDNDYGTIRISESVFAALVRKYTLEVDGVARFASGSLMGGLAEMLGRRGPESSIMVKFDGETVDIAVTLVIEFGAKIPEVSELVQSVVRNRVEEFTGKQVNKVDVIVQGIEEKEEEERANDEGRPQELQSRMGEERYESFGNDDDKK